MSETGIFTEIAQHMWFDFEDSWAIYKSVSQIVLFLVILTVSMFWFSQKRVMYNWQSSNKKPQPPWLRFCQTFNLFIGFDFFTSKWPRKNWNQFITFYMDSETLKLNHTCLFELEFQQIAVSDYGFDHSEAISSLFFLLFLLVWTLD